MLPLVEEYHIDLGFDLSRQFGEPAATCRRGATRRWEGDAAGWRRSTPLQRLTCNGSHPGPGRARRRRRDALGRAELGIPLSGWLGEACCRFGVVVPP